MEEKLKNIVIILAAGNATRLRPLSNRIPKPLIDINGTSIISRIISSFKESGFNKFIVLVGYKSDLIIREVLKDKDIHVEFVEQKEQTGMADAILLCINRINDYYKEIENYFVTAADIIFTKNEILQMYNLFLNSKADMILSLMRSQDNDIAKGHANVKVSNASDLKRDMDVKLGLMITDIIEKPEVNQILSEYYSLPLYLFNQRINSYLEDINISDRGEKEFQDAINKAITNGEFPLGINIIKELITIDNIGEYHLTYLQDIIKMNFRFLPHSPTSPNIIIGKGCEIGDNCKLLNTILYRNVILGENVELSNCLVDEDLTLPMNFKAKDCFLTYDKNENLFKIDF